MQMTACWKQTFTFLCTILVLSASPAVAKLRQSQVQVEGAQFGITIESGALSVSQLQLEQFVRDGAKAVISYYGSFPVRKTIVKVRPVRDTDVGFATSTHDDNAGHGVIEIDIGDRASVKELDNSWVLTHELMHLAFPIVEHEHRWIAEGIATYIEPIGRMRIGKMTKLEMWEDFAKNLKRGLPGPGQGGLNEGGSFDRIYWGGAIYCLVADVEIRKATNNKLGLEDALRAVANRGGTAASDWSAMDAIKVADRAVGQQTLKSLYTKMGVQPASVNINELMSQLGVRRTAKGYELDDRAPLAHIRKAIEGI